jgi:hypothetical protein
VFQFGQPRGNDRYVRDIPKGPEDEERSCPAGYTLVSRLTTPSVTRTRSTARGVGRPARSEALTSFHLVTTHRIPMRRPTVNRTTVELISTAVIVPINSNDGDR